jgi:hypothetical protein
VTASHRRAVLSQLAVTTFEPSGLKAADPMFVPCSNGGTSKFPLAMSHSRTVRSAPKVRIRRPSCANLASGT